MLRTEKELKELKEKVIMLSNSNAQNLTKIVLLDEYICVLEDKIVNIEYTIQKILLANKVLENNIAKLQSDSSCKCKNKNALN